MGNLSVISVNKALFGNLRWQYKCHQGFKISLFENSRWRRLPSWKIHKRVYLGQFLIDCGYGQYKCHQGSKVSLFENSTWRRPPYWKIHKRAYLGQFLIDLHQIWCACRYGQYKCHQGSKMSLFKNSRWWRGPS